MNKTLLSLAAVTILTLAGCHDDGDHMQRTGVNDTPDYAGTHYNPAVNSTGSGVGRNDPAIRPGAGDATGRVDGSGGGRSMNGGGTGMGTSVGGGTSSENGGSSTSSGGTGNSGMGR